MDNPRELDAQNEYGYTALMNACALPGDVGKEIITLLLEAGCNPNVQDNEGYTFLHWLAAVGCDEMIPAVIAAGATVDARSDDSETPAHRFVQCLVSFWSSSHRTSPNTL